MEVIASEFEKPLYEQRKLAWAEVLGSDSHHPEGETEENYPGSHYTWVKMTKPSLEGLRLALQDGGGFSIRRSDGEAFHPFALPNHFIARSDGEFNPWLTPIGKSTAGAYRETFKRFNQVPSDQTKGGGLALPKFNGIDRRSPRWAATRQHC